MKKLLLAGLLVVLAHSGVFGQLSLRPQAGINFASFSEDLLDGDWSSNVGFQIGADLQIGSTFYIQPGINFQSLRLTFEGTEDIDFTANRLNIPVLVGYKFFEQDSRAFGLRLFAGPNLAIHVREDFDDALEGLSGDDIKNADFSLLAGAGLDISIIFVDLAYKFGLGNAIEIESINEDTNINVFLINAGIRIGF